MYYSETKSKTAELLWLNMFRQQLTVFALAIARSKQTSAPGMKLSVVL